MMRTYSEKYVRFDCVRCEGTAVKPVNVYTMVGGSLDYDHTDWRTCECYLEPKPITDPRRMIAQRAEGSR